LLLNLFITDDVIQIMPPEKWTAVMISRAI